MPSPDLVGALEEVLVLREEEEIVSAPPSCRCPWSRTSPWTSGSATSGGARSEAVPETFWPWAPWGSVGVRFTRGHPWSTCWSVEPVCAASIRSTSNSARLWFWSWFMRISNCFLLKLPRGILSAPVGPEKHGTVTPSFLKWAPVLEQDPTPRQCCKTKERAGWSRRARSHSRGCRTLPAWSRNPSSQWRLAHTLQTGCWIYREHFWNDALASWCILKVQEVIAQLTSLRYVDQ